MDATTRVLLMKLCRICDISPEVESQKLDKETITRVLREVLNRMQEQDGGELVRKFEQKYRKYKSMSVRYKRIVGDLRTQRDSLQKRLDNMRDDYKQSKKDDSEKFGFIPGDVGTMENQILKLREDNKNYQWKLAELRSDHSKEEKRLRETIAVLTNELEKAKFLTKNMEKLEKNARVASTDNVHMLELPQKNDEESHSHECERPKPILRMGEKEIGIEHTGESRNLRSNTDRDLEGRNSAVTPATGSNRSTEWLQQENVRLEEKVNYVQEEIEDIKIQLERSLRKSQSYDQLEEDYHQLESKAFELERSNKTLEKLRVEELERLKDCELKNIRWKSQCEEVRKRLERSNSELQSIESLQRRLSIAESGVNQWRRRYESHMQSDNLELLQLRREKEQSDQLLTKYENRISELQGETVARESHFSRRLTTDTPTETLRGAERSTRDVLLGRSAVEPAKGGSYNNSYNQSLQFNNNRQQQETRGDMWISSSHHQVLQPTRQNKLQVTRGLFRKSRSNSSDYMEDLECLKTQTENWQERLDQSLSRNNRSASTSSRGRRFSKDFPRHSPFLNNRRSRQFVSNQRRSEESSQLPSRTDNAKVNSRPLRRVDELSRFNVDGVYSTKLST